MPRLLWPSLLMVDTGFGVLCLGFSSIVQRRVLPALERIGVNRIEVASRRGARNTALSPVAVAAYYSSFEEALDTSSATLVYVSTVNSEHATWVAAALRRDFHVVVDKPSFITLSDGRRLVALAADRGRCLAEATVYAKHPQIDLCQDVFRAAGCRPTRVSAIFSMPPLPAGNFRYRADLGGGALWDLAPYAVSLGRLFLGRQPRAIHCVAGYGQHETEVETAFSVLLSYSAGRTLVGHFGFDTEYRNEMVLLGPGAVVRASPIFTTSADTASALEIRVSNQASHQTAPATDSFGCFLNDVITRICGGEDLSSFSRDLLDDLSVVTSMRRESGCT